MALKKKPAGDKHAAATTSPKSGSVGTTTKAGPAKRATRSEEPLWREVFDRVADEFDWDPGSLQTRTREERMALTLGLFYSQIRRNGAQFWLTNGYAVTWNTAVMRQLRELGTPTARKVAVVLVEIRAVTTLAYKRERERSATGHRGSHGDPALDVLADRCWRLDRRFEKVAPQLMSEVDAFLRDEPLRRSRSSTAWPRLPAMTGRMKDYFC
jgi:hypothetical protein